MKKLLIVLVAVLVISHTLSGVVVYADDGDSTIMREVTYPDGQDVIKLTKNYDLRYKNNLEFMKSRATTSDRLALWLRPSLGIDSENEDIIALAVNLTKSLTDDYTKAQAIHDWVSANIYYDVARSTVYSGGRLIDTQEASYVLKNKIAVCDGYANLTCALLRAAGIPAQQYTGRANGGPHAWTGAYINNQNRWIIIDTTWDSLNRYTRGDYYNGAIRQDYFDPDLYTFSQSHVSTTTIMDNVEVDDEVDEEVLRGGELDYERTDLYFPFKEASLGKYTQCQFYPGFGVWDTTLYFDDSWASSNPKVATVDQKGNVTAHEYGTTTISLAYPERGLYAEFELKVEPQKLSVGSNISAFLVGESSNAYAYMDGFNSENAENIDNENLVWKTSNPKVMTVDNDGRITAIGIGTATITAVTLDGESSGTFSVRVHPALTGIELSEKKLTLKANTSKDLSAKLIPLDAIKPRIEWESSNPEVATVNDGYVRALKKGTATITAYAWDYDNNWNKKVLSYNSCEVIVYGASIIFYDIHNDKILKEIENFEGLITSTYGFDLEDLYLDYKLYDRFTLNTVEVSGEDYRIYVKRPHTYTIYFDSRGGSKVEPIELYFYKTTGWWLQVKEPKAPIRAGYKFMGWYEYTHGGTAERKINFNEEGFSHWDYNLHAKWKKTSSTAKTYKVTFNSNKGSAVKAITTTAKSTIKKPKNPTRKGYKFVAWYKDSALKTKWNFSKDTVTKNTTLYAKWKK